MCQTGENGNLADMSGETKRRLQAIQFQPVTAAAIAKVAPYFNLRADETCDATFVSTYLWKNYYQPQYAVVEERAVLFYAQENGRYFWVVPRCSEADLPEYFALLECYNREILGQDILYMEYVDTRALERLALDTRKYDIYLHTPDLSDYLYRGEDLRQLPGRKYHKKKNHINAFLREYAGRFEYRTLTPVSEERAEIEAFLQEWNQGHSDDMELHLFAEQKGIIEALAVGGLLGIRMGAVYIDGKMKAFSLGSYHPCLDMAIIHVEKADGSIRGLYPYMNQQFLLHEFPAAALVNREDDMGLLGLKKAKESYYPCGRARKYMLMSRVDTRKLWERVFPEDSPQFLDYYYEKKLPDTRVLARRNGAGDCIAMLHLNAFRLALRQHDVDTYYVVAVATAPEQRGRGLMKQLFAEAFGMAAECPFLFLTAVDEAIYTKLGFAVTDSSLLPERFLPPHGCQPEHRLPAETAAPLERECVDLPFQEQDAEAAAQMINRTLAGDYDVYILRDAAYLKRLEAERACEGGQLRIIKENGEITGYYQTLPDENGGRLLIEAVCATEAARRALPPWPQYSEHIAVMMRITNVLQLLSYFVPEGVAEEAWNVALWVEQDELIPDNNGCYIYDRQIGAWKKTINYAEQTVTNGVICVKMNVIGYARWLLGGTPLAQLAAEEAGCVLDTAGAGTDNAIKTAERLKPLKGIFIHELV